MFNSFKQRQIIKFIIITITSISIFSALLNPFLTHFLAPFTIQNILGISQFGITNNFLWQPLTYIFVHPIIIGIDLSFLISLTFNMLILWFIGLQVAQFTGTKHFLYLFFSSSIASGISAYTVMSYTSQNTFIAGCMPTIYALMVMWIMIYPDLKALLMFAIPIQIKWLVAGLIGFNLLVNVSQVDIAGITITIAGSLTGYLFATIGYQLHTPFQITRTCDEFLADYSIKIKNKLRKKTLNSRRNNIYDIRTGKTILNDEDFLDAMFEKIKIHGKNSLSDKERHRMDNISQRNR